MTARLGARRRVPLPLAVLLVLAALQGIAWAVVIAPVQGPDESAHLSYVQNLVEAGRAPSFAGGTGQESSELGTGMLSANLLATVGVASVKPAATSVDERRFEALAAALPPGSKRNAGGPNSVAKNPPLYYLWESAAYRAGRGWGLFDRLFLMRLATVLLFVATVLFAWLAAAEVFADTWRRTVACGFVALQPELAFMSGVVNPDTLLALVWTAFTFAGLRLLLRGPTFWRVLGVLAAVVASALTQGRGLPLIPAGLFVLGVALWRHRPVRRASLAGLAAGGALTAVAAVVYRLTLGPASHAYKAEISFRSPTAFDPWQFVSQVWQFYLPKLPGMTPRLGPPYGVRAVWVESLWGVFGSLEVRFPGWTYDAIQAALTCLVVALPVTMFLRRRALRWDVVAFLAVTVGSLLVFLHLAAYRNLLGTDDPLLVGRYLLPLLLPMGLAVVFVLDRLPRHVAAYTMAVVLAFEAVLGLSGLGLSLTRFYG